MKVLCKSKEEWEEIEQSIAGTVLEWEGEFEKAPEEDQS